MDSLVDVSVSIAVAFLASIEKFRSITFAFLGGGRNFPLRQVMLCVILFLNDFRIEKK